LILINGWRCAASRQPGGWRWSEMKKSDIKIIPFDKRFIEKALTLADGRNTPKEKQGVTSKKCDETKTEFGAHWGGALGEVGLATYLDSETDDDFYLHGDNGYDLVFRGYKIAIRTRSYYGNNLELYFDNDDKFNWDIAVLARAWPDKVELFGCISQKRFREICVDGGYGYGPRKIIQWTQLAPIKRLFDLPKKINGNR